MKMNLAVIVSVLTSIRSMEKKINLGDMSHQNATKLQEKLDDFANGFLLSITDDLRKPEPKMFPGDLTVEERNCLKWNWNSEWNQSSTREIPFVDGQIPCIKLVRERFYNSGQNLSLKEAKEYVEAWITKNMSVPPLHQ